MARYYIYGAGHSMQWAGHDQMIDCALHTHNTHTHTCHVHSTHPVQDRSGNRGQMCPCTGTETPCIAAVWEGCRFPVISTIIAVRMVLGAKVPDLEASSMGAHQVSNWPSRHSTLVRKSYTGRGHHSAQALPGRGLGSHCTQQNTKAISLSLTMMSASVKDPLAAMPAAWQKGVCRTCVGS